MQRQADTRSQAPTRARHWFRWVRVFLNGCAALFVALAVVDLWRRWDGAAVQVDPGWLLCAGVCSAATMLWQFLGWRTLVRSWCGQHMPWPASARLYLDSQLARYTPGKVGLPAVRIAGALLLAVSPRVMAATLGIELLSWCAVGASSSLLVFGILLSAAGGAHPGGDLASLPWASGALVLASACFFGCLLLMFLDRRRIPGVLRDLLQAEGEGPLIPPALAFYHLLHFGSWMLCGVCLSLSLGKGWADGLWAGASLGLSIIAGFLALLAPAGAGVREVIVTYMLAPLWGPSVALSFSILARATSLVTDVGLWALVRLPAFRGRRR